MDGRALAGAPSSWAPVRAAWHEGLPRACTRLHRPLKHSFSPRKGFRPQDQARAELFVRAGPGGSLPAAENPKTDDNGSFLEFYLRLLKSQRPDLLSSETNPRGHVFLVGTGPGDPELLTIKALRAMQTADVVLYDRLVSDEILAHVAPRAVMVYVGKQKGFHTRTQDEIEALLLAFAGLGARVVRLKGGDPYIFGRGGEEAVSLRAQGHSVTAVPGITAAAGIGAELGIPLTHRGLATGVKFVTGHAREGSTGVLNQGLIESSQDPDTTLVVYMGLGTLRALRDELIERGMDDATPAAAIERGTTPRQRAVFARIRDLPAVVARAELESPTLLIIGKVVSVSPGWEKAVIAEDGSALLQGLGNGFADEVETWEALRALGVEEFQAC